MSFINNFFIKYTNLSNILNLNTINNRVLDKKLTKILLLFVLLLPIVLLSPFIKIYTFNYVLSYNVLLNASYLIIFFFVYITILHVSHGFMSMIKDYIHTKKVAVYIKALLNLLIIGFYYYLYINNILYIEFF